MFELASLRNQIMFKGGVNTSMYCNQMCKGVVVGLRKREGQGKSTKEGLEEETNLFLRGLNT